MIFVKDFKQVKDWKHSVEQNIDSLNSKMIHIVLVTSDPNGAIQYFPNQIILKCDATALKTAARVCPTYFFMNNDLIVDKLSYRNQKKIDYWLHSYTFTFKG
jgi:hypothetical protein